MDLMTTPPILSNEGWPPREIRSSDKGTGLGQYDLPRIREGGIDCLFFAFYVDPQYLARLKRLLQMLDTFYSEVEKNPENIAIATSHEEVLSAVKKGKVAAVMSVEGGEPLEGSVEVLRILYKLGVRSLTLTHFPRNLLGDGSGADSASHLTDFGKAVVGEMNRVGMIVDVSHLNETGFWDVIDKTSEPVMASHSNCKSVYNHHRNLTDEQIRSLADNGGVMNLNFCGQFIKEGVELNSPESLRKVSLENWLDHLDHAYNLVGPDHLGLGSDLPICWFPGMEDYTKFPNVTRGLVSRGYSDEDIEKILGGNNMRLIKEVLG
jgi:membrane dipeptidase